MKYFYHPAAEAEFYDAIEYYESCAAGLGYDFSIEVHSTIERILLYPKAWPILVNDIRRCQTNRFPYGILYIEEQAEIYIIAVMHLQRDPTYWHKRRNQT
jgi:plasmid stabilization system protein ParE